MIRHVVASSGSTSWRDEPFGTTNGAAAAWRRAFGQARRRVNVPLTVLVTGQLSLVISPTLIALVAWNLSDSIRPPIHVIQHVMRILWRRSLNQPRTSRATRIAAMNSAKLGTIRVVHEDRRVPRDNIVRVVALRWLRARHVRHHAIELLLPLSRQRVSSMVGDGDSNRDSNMGARRDGPVQAQRSLSIIAVCLPRKGTALSRPSVRLLRCDDRKWDGGSEEGQGRPRLGDGGCAGGDDGARLRPSAGAQPESAAVVTAADVVGRPDLLLGACGDPGVVEDLAHRGLPGVVRRPEARSSPRCVGCQPGPVRTGAIVLSCPGWRERAPFARC